MYLEIPKIINTRPKSSKYILDESLKKAVEVAMTFNQPLLLTGEPGTGKTLLAYKVADMLYQQTKDATNGQVKFAEEPLRFNTKTSSIARDLFYIYDAIGHFQHANIKTEDATNKKSVKEFIELQAIGKAIALANPKAAYDSLFKWEMPDYPQSSVVLVDEIDKAPRDFTNDILNEIERQEFFIKEQDNQRLALGNNKTQRILTIMTSNSEKNLPDAFLRRCVFYHINFPSPEKLQQILKAQLESADSEFIDKNLSAITDLFEKIRKAAIRKKPATAELVAFVKLMEMENHLTDENPNVKQWFLNNLSLLAKSKEDIEAISKILK